MEARAQARYVRVTPMKARRVIDLIRGLPAAEAQAILHFAPQAASEPVGKVLDSAIANATNNFKLYSRRFLNATSIESEAGFELALELSVKATLQRRRLAEVPTTWRDRTGGESRFRLRKWLPHYLRWYVAAFRGRLGRARTTRA